MKTHEFRQEDMRIFLSLSEELVGICHAYVEWSYAGIIRGYAHQFSSQFKTGEIVESVIEQAKEYRKELGEKTPFTGYKTVRELVEG